MAGHRLCFFIIDLLFNQSQNFEARISLCMHAFDSHMQIPVRRGLAYARYQIPRDAE